MDDKIAIETITAIPRNQFYWKYQINEGIFHTIRKEQAFKYFSSFLQRRNFLILRDYLDHFLPFLIIVNQDEIIELKKIQTDIDYFRTRIKDDLHNQMRNPQMPREEEKIPNDDKIEKILKSFLK